MLNSANLANEQAFNIGYSNPAAAPTGTVTLSGFPSGVPTTATLYAGVDANTSSPAGIATVTIPSTAAAGNHNVNITYNGDSNYAGTSTGSFNLPIQNVGGVASSITASISGSISPASTVTLTGTVTGKSGDGAPGNANGGVMIYSSGYSLGTVGVTPGTGITSTFSVTLSSQILLQGSNNITVQYLGDTTYAPSAYTFTPPPISSPLSDFSMVPETTIVPVTAGSSGTDTINLSSVNGFAGAVSFTCAPTPTGNPVTCNVSSSATLSPPAAPLRLRSPSMPALRSPQATTTSWSPAWIPPELRPHAGH